MEPAGADRSIPPLDRPREFWTHNSKTPVSRMQLSFSHGWNIGTRKPSAAFAAIKIQLELTEEAELPKELMFNLSVVAGCERGIYSHGRRAERLLGTARVRPMRVRVFDAAAGFVSVIFLPSDFFAFLLRSFVGGSRLDVS
jgi:hypothetical protein